MPVRIDEPGVGLHFVPLAGAYAKAGTIQVNVTADEVKRAPGIEPGRRRSEQEEEELFAHY